MVEVPPGFQPAGRAPAPPPLDLVQDFVNTEIAVWSVDDIATPDALADWLRSRDLLPERAVVDAGSFVRARALRLVLRSLASRNAHGATSADDLRSEFATLAPELPLRFTLSERGDLRLAPADHGVNGALAEILSRVFEAQTSGEWRRLKSCPGPHCGWLFYDASRNASSRWCSMSICGNRTKTAAYRRASKDRNVRSAWFVTSLAWKRLRRRDSGALVTILGLVVATAVLAGVFAGVTIASDRATAQAIERIPASERSVRAVWFGIPGDTSERLAALDRAVDEAFSGFGLDGPTPLILFRESTVAGRFVGITAIDGVGEHVTLRSGRLPRTCTLDRCEVLRLRGRGALPSASGLRIVEVGTGTLRSRQLYGDFLLSSDAATADATIPPDLGETSEYHRPPPAPLVVAEGRAALASAAELARTYRTYAWVWPIGPGNPRLWDVDELVQRSERARIELSERSSSFAVEAPVDELREIERAAEVAGTRLLLVGGEGAALLLAFTILAARGMRRDLHAARRRLTWFGAQRWQLWLLGGVESSVVAVVGVVLGWVAGIVVAGIVAELAGAPVFAVLGESVVSPLGLGVAAAAAVVAAALVFITVSLPQREGARIGALDLVAAAAVLVVVVALVGGAADEAQLTRGEGTALLLLLLPGLIAIAAALVVARSSRRWRDSGPTTGVVGFRLGLRPSDWRAGRALRSRRSRFSPSRSPSHSWPRGIERRSCAAIESRLRSRCRTTWSSAKTSGTWFVSSKPLRSSASTSSSARTAPHARCCG